MKSLTILLSIALFLLILSFGCCGAATNVANKPTGESAISAPNFCPNFKVPSDFAPTPPGNGSSYAQYSFVLISAELSKVDWDGWTPLGEIPCRNGKKTGENTNYLYCFDPIVNPTNNKLSSTMSKAITDDKGTILANKEYASRWIFEPKGDNWALKEIRFYVPYVNSFSIDSNVCVSTYSG